MSLQLILAGHMLLPCYFRASIWPEQLCYSNTCNSGLKLPYWCIGGKFMTFLSFIRTVLAQNPSLATSGVKCKSFTPCQTAICSRLTLPNNVHDKNDIRIEKRICEDSNHGTPSPLISTALRSLRIISLRLKRSRTSPPPPPQKNTILHHAGSPT